MATSPREPRLPAEHPRHERVENGHSRPWKLGVLALVFYATILAVYFVGRFGANWSEGDMARIAQSVASMVESGSLVAPGVYANGYGYPALSLFLVQAIGISIPALQAYVLPLFVPAIVVVAFIAYRSLLGRTRAALLATVFVVLHSDFLFVAFRGSHEKVTWTLVFLALFFLARSLRSSRDPLARQAPWVILFYLVVFALIATNVFFASSFIWALALSFGAVLLLAGIAKSSAIDVASPTRLRRLWYVTLTSVVLVFLFIFYAYSPALRYLQTLSTLAERFIVLLLDFGSGDQAAGASADLFRTVWINRGFYFLISSFNYLITLLAGVTWLAGVWRFLRPGTDRQNELESPLLFLWLLFPAFALQLLASLFASWTNTVGTNLHLRLFTPTSLVGMPIAALGIIHIVRRLRSARARRFVAAVAVSLAALFALFALLKMTSEPLFSTRWIVYDEAEVRAGEWSLDYLGGGRTVWAGPDGRVARSLEFLQSSRGSVSAQFDAFEVDPDTTHFLLSDLERIRYLHLGIPLPDFRDEQRVYDNGEVKGYYRRPHTPFQQ